MLASALKPTSPLRPKVLAGLGAMLPGDRALFRPDQSARVGDSLDLDTAARAQHPQDNRWDYVVSVPDQKKLVGIEPHQGKDSEVSVVIAKKEWAKAYLRNHLHDGRYVASWIWVVHGRVKLTKNERNRRRLDQAGISFQGREIRAL
jgi:hypothetical protein